jgi:hypothetical protein
MARAGKRHPAFIMVAIFIFWQYLLKILSCVYLDIAGPLFSEEIQMNVGGGGYATPLLSVFLFVPMWFLYLALKPRVGSPPPPPEKNLARRGTTLGDLIVAGMIVFVIALYVDMFARGNIPFFTGLDRFQYKGGIFHNFLQDFLFFVGFTLGFVLARQRMLLGTWDLRVVSLFGAIFVYLFLAGHRFGAFYAMTSFVLVPLAAIPYARRNGWPVAEPSGRITIIQRIARSPTAVGAAVVLALTLVGGAMIHNLYVVRDYGDAAGDKVLQRLFVQPVHLYWLTWERLSAGEISNAGAVIDFMFNNPLDATRNTGIQYLMIMAIGEQASTNLIDNNSQFAGGYPEILIELGGPWIGFALACIAAAVVAILYRLSVVAVCRGHYLSAVMSIYVCFGFLVFYVGGMVNFLTAWTYWVKIAVFLVVLVLDRLLERGGHRLLPWKLFPARKAVAPRGLQPRGS